jgi:hypothetical protein
MKTFHINTINAIMLIIMGLWGYFGSCNPSITAMIPVYAGVVLLLFTKGLQAGNKTIAHIVVVITLLILIALFKPLSGAISRNDTAAIIRVSLMIFTSFVAMVFYIKSFVDARRKREE